MVRVVLISSVISLLLIVGAGCTPFVPVTDMTTVSPSERAAAANVRVFALGQSAPTVLQSLGQVTAYSCKLMMTDPPASKGNALEQLQLKAAQAGGNALINVTFDTRGVDTYGTNCWETVQASGTAVKVGQ